MILDDTFDPNLFFTYKEDDYFEVNIGLYSYVYTLIKMNVGTTHHIAVWINTSEYEAKCVVIYSDLKLDTNRDISDFVSANDSHICGLRQHVNVLIRKLMIDEFLGATI